MKSIKNLLLCFALTLFSVVSVMGQISITNSDMPKSGDTLRFSNSNNLTLNLTSTGVNTVWDYKNLTPNSQDVSSYVNFLQTPYFFYSQFFGAIGLKTADTINLGILTMTNVTTFYKSKTAAFTAEGLGFSTSGIPLASDYSTADVVYKFPLNYNQIDSNPFRVVTTLPTLGSLIQQGKRFNHVDGWGKISTPYANSVACLRVKSDIIEVDSLKTSFLSFGFPVSRREIKWLSNTEKIPILEVTGALLAGNFTPAQVKYRDSFRANSQGPPPPQPTFSVNKRTGTTKDTFDFVANSNPPFGVSYKWIFSPNKAKFVKGSTLNSKNAFVVFTDTGKYDVRLTATNNNGSKDTFNAKYISISGTSSVEKTTPKIELVLLPNPVQDYISVTPAHANSLISLEIYSLTGAKVLETSFYGSYKLDVSMLASGKYIVKANAANEQTTFVFEKQ